MRLVLTLAAAVVGASAIAQAPPPVEPRANASDRATAVSVAYDEKVTRARALLKSNESRAALAASQEAIALDEKRWEAYVVAASAYSSQGLHDDAAGMLQSALARAPDARKPPIRDALALARKMASDPSRPVPAVGEVPVAPVPTQAEVVLWKSIENSRAASDFTGYLERYPDGTFAPVAKTRLAALRESSKSPEELAADLVAKIVAIANNVRARGETQSVFASGCILSVVRTGSNRSTSQTFDLRRAEEAGVQVSNDAGIWSITGLAAQGPSVGSSGGLRAPDQATVSQLFALVPNAIRACKETGTQVTPAARAAPSAAKAPPATPVYADKRQAAFTGAWKCVQRTKYDRRRERESKSETRTKFYETAYADGRFSMNGIDVKSDMRSDGDLVDGVSRNVGEGEYSQQRRAVWDGEAIVITWSDNKQSSGAGRYQVIDGNLIAEYESDNREDDTHFASRESCTRIGIQEATDTVRKIRSDIRASMEDIVQFVRIAALKAWNIRAKVDDPGFCEIQWTGADFSLDDPPSDQSITLIPAIIADYRVQRGRYSDAYVFDVSGTFWFRSPDQAGHFIQLARKATELCQNFP